MFEAKANATPALASLVSVFGVVAQLMNTARTTVCDIQVGLIKLTVSVCRCETAAVFEQDNNLRKTGSMNEHVLLPDHHEVRGGSAQGRRMATDASNEEMYFT